MIEIEDLGFLVGGDFDVVKDILLNYCYFSIRVISTNGLQHVIARDWRLDRVNVETYHSKYGYRVTKFVSIG